MKKGKKEIDRDYYEKNKDVIKSRSLIWNRDNQEQKLLNNKIYYNQNIEKIAIQARARYEKNKERDKLRAKLWRENNKGRVAANLAKRRADKRNATPQWADIKQIRKLYEEAQQRTELEGIDYQVDHIVPLKGKLVCGLHCTDNLQILTAEENNRKNNSFLIE